MRSLTEDEKQNGLFGTFIGICTDPFLSGDVNSLSNRDTGNQAGACQSCSSALPVSSWLERGAALIGGKGVAQRLYVRQSFHDHLLGSRRVFKRSCDDPAKENRLVSCTGSERGRRGFSQFGTAFDSRDCDRDLWGGILYAHSDSGRACDGNCDRHSFIAGSAISSKDNYERKL